MYFISKLFKTLKCQVLKSSKKGLRVPRLQINTLQDKVCARDFGETGRSSAFSLRKRESGQFIRKNRPKTDTNTTPTSHV
jgi:hypothetical protein